MINSKEKEMAQIRLLTAKDVAESWGTSIQSVRIWTWNGRIPSIKIGRSVRYLPEIIDKITKEGLPTGKK